MSPFGKILQTFCEQFPQVETAVIHDSTGETIDYYSYDDPYRTRLVAAHFGLVFQITSSKLDWLGLGKTRTTEISSASGNCKTILLEDDFYLTVMIHGKVVESEFNAVLQQTTKALKEEAGY